MFVIVIIFIFLILFHFTHVTLVFNLSGRSLTTESSKGAEEVSEKNHEISEGGRKRRINMRAISKPNKQTPFCLTGHFYQDTEFSNIQ